jgi:8-oxo-dGTP pyrophosphatase MutT (NUDIX family)
MENNSLIEIDCSGALICARDTHRFLLLQKREGKHAGRWGLVGGTNHSNESAWQGLCREIEEELGGTIRGAKIIPIEKFTSDNGNFTYHTFISPVVAEFVPKLNEEHRGYCWVRLEDHPRPLHPGVWRTINFEAVASKIKTLESIL